MTELAQAGKAALLRPKTANVTSQGVVCFIIIYGSKQQDNRQRKTNSRRSTDSS